MDRSLNVNRSSIGRRFRFFFVFLKGRGGDWRSCYARVLHERLSFSHHDLLAAKGHMLNPASPWYLKGYLKVYLKGYFAGAQTKSPIFSKPVRSPIYFFGKCWSSI